MIKAVIFDFFGVIGLSTYQVVAEKYKLSTEQGVLLKDLHKSHDYGFMDDDEFLHAYSDILGISYESFIREFYNSRERFRVHDEMLSYIRELRNIYKIGLLSNVGEDAYRKFIEPIANEFDVVVKSYEVELAKPDVAIFELMSHKLGVDVSECVMIDDSEINCEGARAAGMESICHTSLVATKAQLRDIFDLSTT